MARSSAYTSAMFSETRYALNGDLRVAYRASREGPRDIVFVPNWFTSCEVVPELPSIQGWVEAMTSLGRLIFFDQPGTGASDPVTPGALPTLEQWADSITAVLDDLGSREAVLLAVDARVRARGAVRGDTSVAHHRAGRARRLRRCGRHPTGSRRIPSCDGPHVGQRGDSTSDESGHAVERGDPGNVGSDGTPGGEPRDRCSHDAARGGIGRAGGPSDSPRADPGRPPRRRRAHPAREGQVHRRAHTRREIR